MHNFIPNPNFNNQQYMQDLLNYNQVPPPNFNQNQLYQNNMMPNDMNYQRDNSYQTFGPNSYNCYPNAANNSVNYPNPNLNPYQNNMMYNFPNPYQNTSTYNNSNNRSLSSHDYLYSMYPEIYKISKPVITKVLFTSNMNNFNEDSLNRMADTVLKIIDNDINYKEEYENNIKEEAEKYQATNNKNQSERTSSINSVNMNNQTTNNSNITQNQIKTDIECLNKLKELETKILTDFIKVLILDEINNSYR